MARQAPQSGAAPADQSVSCTTAFSIDHDCDGYGVGHDYVLGPDADDNDPAVNTLDTVLATYGDVATFLAKNKGIKPAGTWYLSPTGNDKNCAKNDVNRPCATYAVVRTKIGSGDLLLIRGGTYDEASKPFTFPSANGTAARPTVVMAYPGEDVILRRTADGSDPWGMYLNANYAIVDGIELTTLTPDHGKGIDVTKSAESVGVTIRNSEVSFFYTNIFGCFGGKDLHVEGNVLHDARSEHNIYTCNNKGSTGHQVGTIIQDNVMYAARWNNIHLNTNYCDGCIIRRNILWSSNETGGGTANIAIQSGFKNGDIDSNVLFNYSGYGLLFNTYTDGQAGIGVPSDMTGNTIANNTMVDTARDLIGHNFGGQCLATISVQNTSKVPTVDLGHNFYINNVLVHANSSHRTAARWSPTSRSTRRTSIGGRPTRGRTTRCLRPTRRRRSRSGSLVSRSPPGSRRSSSSPRSRPCSPAMCRPIRGWNTMRTRTSRIRCASTCGSRWPARRSTPARPASVCRLSTCAASRGSRRPRWALTNVPDFRGRS